MATELITVRDSAMQSALRRGEDVFCLLSESAARLAVRAHAVETDAQLTDLIEPDRNDEPQQRLAGADGPGSPPKSDYERTLPTRASAWRLFAESPIAAAATCLW